MLDAGGHTARSAVKKTARLPHHRPRNDRTKNRIPKLPKARTPAGRRYLLEASLQLHSQPLHHADRLLCPAARWTKNSGTYPVHEPIADFEDLSDVDLDLALEAPAGRGEADVRGDAALGTEGHPCARGLRAMSVLPRGAARCIQGPAPILGYRSPGSAAPWLTRGW